MEGGSLTSGAHKLSASGETARQAALEEKLQEYHSVDIDSVLKLISYLRDPSDTVLVGGSLAYGLGNGRSDLDIVLAGPETNESSSRMPLEHFLKSLRVDVWKLMACEIDELFARAEDRLASEAPFQGAFGTVSEQADLKLLHRLAYGVVLDGPALRPATTRSYRDIAGDIVMREYAERMREAIYMAQIAMSTDNPLPAVASARFAVEDALQIAVAGLAVPFCDNKWLQTRLLNDLPELWPTYSPFRRLPASSKDAGDFVQAALATCQRLTGLDLDLASLSAYAEWNNADLQYMEVGAEHFLLLAKQGALWSLDDDEKRAWAALGDQDAWPCQDCDEDQQKLCIALHLRGMLTLSWKRGISIDSLTHDPTVKAA